MRVAQCFSNWVPLIPGFQGKSDENLGNLFVFYSVLLTYFYNNIKMGVRGNMQRQVLYIFTGNTL
jgi:hypothetical protein